ncbi:hypothetical protein [Kutzneria buriramensis]|nr:hypothetical protein [Kutzneria buriramensis]
MTARTREWHRPMVFFTGAMAVMAVVSALGMLFDSRTLAGEPIWQKDFDFALSIGMYCLTWAWLTSMLPRGRRTASWVSTALVALLSVEYILLTVQIIRGQRSHFNKSTDLNSALGNVMGISAGLILVGSLVLAFVFVFVPVGDPADRWAIRLGALLSVAGMAFGPMMGAATPQQQAAKAAGTWDGIQGAHSVGVADGSGPLMPITGWSETGGDLRIPHLVGLHALQALPVLVLLLVLGSRWVPKLRSSVVRARLVGVGAVGWAGLLAIVGWQALRGQPLIHPDALTLGAFGLLVALVVVLAGLVLVLSKPVRAEATAALTAA